jgi:succinate dehydrogenase / fumarate reductase membrane anchor subunit
VIAYIQVIQSAVDGDSADAQVKLRSAVVRTPLGKVRGLGSARSGTSEHVAKQFSGVILGLLTPYVIGLAIVLAGKPYDQVVELMRSMWVAPPLTAFIVISVYHMRIGMKVIIEDYVHHELTKLTLMALNWLFAWSLGLLCAFAGLKLFLS